MTLAVPNSSTEKSISAQAAYSVFGFGQASSQVPPWDQVASIFQRGPTSGTQAMIGAADPGRRWPRGTLSVVEVEHLEHDHRDRTGANGTAAAANTIGVLAAEDADANRATLHELAYQHVGQHCGYLPDSAPNKFDKRNVRDGHYAILGPDPPLAADRHRQPERRQPLYTSRT